MLVQLIGYKIYQDGIEMLETVIEIDMFNIFLFLFITGILLMSMMVYRKSHLFMGSQARLSTIVFASTFVMLFMGAALIVWYIIAASSPDYVISPFDVSKFWGSFFTVFVFSFIAAIAAGFMALHIYRGGA